MTSKKPNYYEQIKNLTYRNEQLERENKAKAKAILELMQGEAEEYKSQRILEQIMSCVRYRPEAFSWEISDLDLSLNSEAYSFFCKYGSKHV